MDLLADWLSYRSSMSAHSCTALARNPRRLRFHPCDQSSTLLCSHCLPYFVDSLLRTGTVRALQFIESVPRREAAPHIIKRRGARMCSLTLLYHGRLFHCSVVSSNFSAVSSAKSANICPASSA